jgi:DsrE/DsrF/DsrH-like protein
MTTPLNQPETAILITRAGMGESEPSLQRELLQKYLRLLLDSGMLPGAMCFYTEGVRLVVDGSPVLDLLQALEGKGVRLIVCLTCLKHFGLTDKVKVGIVGGMGDILAAQWSASKVITI